MPFILSATSSALPLQQVTLGSGSMLILPIIKFKLTEICCYVGNSVSASKDGYDTKLVSPRCARSNRGLQGLAVEHLVTWRAVVDDCRQEQEVENGDWE